MAAAASSAAAILAWTSQRQWLADGGALASYPLPVASGPVMALPVYGGSQVTGSLAADASLIMKSQ